MHTLPCVPPPREAHLQPGRAGRVRRLAGWAIIAAVLVIATDQLRPYLRGAGTGTELLVYGAVFLVIFVVLFARTALQLRGFTRANARATALVFDGKFAEACEAFEQNARRFRSPSLHLISLYNLADTSVQRGDFDRALSLACAVASYRGMLRSPLIAASAPALVATGYALRGDLDAARAWLPEAARAAATLPTEVALVPEAIVACREGQFARVAARIAERRRAIDSSLAGNDLRLLRLMHAFALVRGAEVSPEERAEALALARPGVPGEYDYVAARWPEMKQFLADQARP